MCAWTVFSQGTCPLWQADLLGYTYHKTRQPGQLLCLAGLAPQSHLYLPANKPYAIKTWLEATSPSVDAILILDPDFIFLGPLKLTARRGVVEAERVDYLDPGRYEAALSRFCSDLSVLRPMGCPVLMHSDDLRQVAPRWFALTVSMMERIDYRSQLGWILEMWAFVIACNELGLEWAERHFANHSLDNEIDGALVHYCYGGATFDKRSYEPWSHVASTGPRALQRVIIELNELASFRRAVHLPSEHRA